MKLTDDAFKNFTYCATTMELCTEKQGMAEQQLKYTSYVLFCSYNLLMHYVNGTTR